MKRPVDLPACGLRLGPWPIPDGETDTESLRPRQRRQPRLNFQPSCARARGVAVVLVRERDTDADGGISLSRASSFYFRLINDRENSFLDSFSARPTLHPVNLLVSLVAAACLPARPPGRLLISIFSTTLPPPPPPGGRPTQCLLGCALLCARASRQADQPTDRVKRPCDFSTTPTSLARPRTSISIHIVALLALLAFVPTTPCPTAARQP